MYHGRSAACRYAAAYYDNAEVLMIVYSSYLLLIIIVPLILTTYLCYITLRSMKINPSNLIINLNADFSRRYDILYIPRHDQMSAPHESVRSKKVVSPCSMVSLTASNGIIPMPPYNYSHASN